MHIIQFLQTNRWRSRRKIVWLIQNNQIFLNNNKIESFKSEVNNWDVIRIMDTDNENEILKVTEYKDNNEWNLIIFNKPKGYVVSKFDSHNKTIYELLPKKFSSWYYIWRLDKESRWLVLLTNKPSLVNQYEHPKFEIEKEYLIKLSTQFKEEDKQRAKSWLIDEWELLKFKDILATKNTYTYKVILREWKKRHIRRVIKKLWYNLLDLQRIKEGEWRLPQDLQEWKRIFAK